MEKLFNKDLNKIKNIFIKAPFFFGNQIVALNNLIYYSEILGIKNIYFNSKYDFYIKNDIYTNKIHISLKQKKEINCSSLETICCNLYNDFFFLQVIKPERRSLILKNEIKRNLPKINVKKMNYIFTYVQVIILIKMEIYILLRLIAFIKKYFLDLNFKIFIFYQLTIKVL